MGKVKKVKTKKSLSENAVEDEFKMLENGDHHLADKAVAATKERKSTPAKATKAKNPKDAGGVTQFNPNLNLASLFSSNSSSSGKMFKTVIHDQPAFPPIKKIDRSDKKSAKLKNKDAAQIRIDAKAKFQKSSDTEIKGKKSKNKKPKLTKNDTEIVGTEEDCEMGTAEASTLTSEQDESEKDGEPVIKPQKSFLELNQPKPKNEELEHRTAFVGNVPKELIKEANHHTLKKLFNPFGKIETIRYRSVTSAKPTMLKKVAAYRNEIHPNRSTVSAYIRFATREEAELASKEVNGLKLQDFHLSVDLANNSGSKRDNKKAIFIGNLQLNTQDEDLWKFFEDCGPIESVRVVRDQASGLGKGFGYVNFQDAASIELALTKNEEILNGRPLRISRAVKKLKKKKGAPEAKGGGQDTESKSMKSKVKGKPKLSQSAFTGDRMSEIGKLKRGAKKMNKGDLKKARIAKQLTGKSPASGEKSAYLKRKFDGIKKTTKKPRSSSARKTHSRERSANFKKQSVPAPTNVAKKKAPFKRYFSK